MAPTNTRTPARGLRTKAKLNIRCQAPSRLGDGRARRASARSNGTAPTFSMLAPSHGQINTKPTEEAMPDPDAGPSHRPGARTLGGTS